MERAVVLAQGEKRAWPTAVLGWRGARTTDADGIVLARVIRQDLLDANRVLPEVVEVVLIAELLARAETAIRQTQVGRVVGKGDPTEVGGAITLAVNHKAVEVGIGPGEGGLDDGVEICNRGITADQEPAPNERADAVDP